jgi:hypothetical protein
MKLTINGVTYDRYDADAGTKAHWRHGVIAVGPVASSALDHAAALTDEAVALRGAVREFFAARDASDTEAFYGTTTDTSTDRYHGADSALRQLITPVDPAKE